MKPTSRQQKITLDLLLVLMLQFVLLISIFLDIAVARQVFSIVYLAFIPGFILLKLIGAEKFDTLEKILFSLVFSIIILLLLGLFINQLGSIIGFSEPLGLLPMITTITVFVMGGVIASYLRSAPCISLSQGKFEAKGIVFFILPLLSVIGALEVAANGSNSILLLTLALVATVMGLAIVSRKIVPPKYYALVILCVSLTLVFHTSFSTTRIHGYDIHSEYSVFLETYDANYWDAQSANNMNVGRFSSMLSITILPTIYSNISNLDPAWILKIVFPIFLAFIPLFIFKLCKPRWGDKTALVSALLVTVQATFFVEMLGLCREIVAELFLVSLLVVLFGRDVFPKRIENLCFILFSFGMIVSHYGISLIFLFILVGVWGLIQIRRRVTGKITLISVLLFSVMLFGWYMFVRSGATMQSIMQIGEFVATQLGSFFNFSSRGDVVALGLGVGVFDSAQSNWQVIGRFVAYGTQFLIALGFLSLLIKRRNDKRQNKETINREYFYILLLGTALLGMTIIVPGFATTLAMTRWYHITLLLISPFLVLGCKQCVSLVIRNNKVKHAQLTSILIVLIVVPYFLFQTNFVYEVAGVNSWSVPLSKYRMDESLLYGWTGFVDDLNVFPSQWFSQNVDPAQFYPDQTNNQTQAESTLYTDPGTFFVLRSYGRTKQFQFVTNYTHPAKGDFVYLSSLAISHGVILHPYTFDPQWDSSEIAPQLEFMSNIYSNGKSGIWINYMP